MNLQIPVKLLPLLKPRRYKSVRGGRGSGKSHTVARILLALGRKRQVRVLCCREVQKTIASSVHQLLSDLIREWGWEIGQDHGFYKITQNGIVGLNGTEFIFSGLSNVTADNVKSFEGVDFCWIEEAQRVSARSWQILTPTIRKPGSEIWATWNPDLETDEVYRRTITSPWVPPEHMMDLECNWRDNPWFPEVLNLERLQLKALNDDLYQHVWEGKTRSRAGLLFKRHWFNWYEPEDLPEQLTFYLPTDYATTDIEDPEVQSEPDYTELGVVGHDRSHNLWFTDWWSGQTDPEEWIGEMARLIRSHSVQRTFEEKGPIYRATKSAIDRRLKEKGVFVVRTPIASMQKKAERAMGFVARAGAGSVYLPKGKPWAERLIEQLCSFTGEDGRIDDMVDACSILARGLDKLAVPDEPPKPKRRPRPFSEEHLFHDHDDRNHEAEAYLR